MFLATAILLLHPQLAVTPAKAPTVNSDSAISASVDPLDSDLPLPMTTASSDPALEPAGESTTTKGANANADTSSASAGIMDTDLPLPMTAASDPALEPTEGRATNSSETNSASADMMDMDLPLPMTAASDPALEPATATMPAISVSASMLDADMPLPLTTPTSEAAPEPAAEPTEALPDAPLPLASVVMPTAPMAFIQPVQPMTVSVDELRAENRRRQMIWTGLAIASSGAATFDAWTTRHTITTDGAQELNPLLKPFASNGSIYVAIQVAPALLDYAGHKMMYSRHSWMRRTWWVPQSASFVTSLFCGSHNLAFH